MFQRHGRSTNTVTTYLSRPARSGLSSRLVVVWSTIAFSCSSPSSAARTNHVFVNWSSGNTVPNSIKVLLLLNIVHSGRSNYPRPLCYCRRVFSCTCQRALRTCHCGCESFVQCDIASSVCVQGHLFFLLLLSIVMNTDPGTA